MNAVVKTPRTALRPILIVGFLGLLLLIGGMGGLASSAVISGAVIAPGQAMVRGKPQEIQHLDGGLIQEIRVEDGDAVEKGDLLMTLDSTSLALRRDMSRTQLVSLLARQQRLRAEQADRDSVTFAYPDFPFDLPEISQAETDELGVFEVRAQTRAGRVERLAETKSDLSDRIEGTKAQIAALDEAMAFVDEDRERIESLSVNGLVTRNQMTELMRERASLVQRRAALETELTGLGNDRRAAETEAAQAERQFHEEVAAQLSEIGPRIEELALEITDLEGRLGRVEIRAPVAGVVHDMQVTTTGGVVAPGDTILTIIPQDRGVTFQIRVDPRTVDQVHPGQEAEVIVAAFDPRTTPRMKGTVVWVSPDTVTDQRTGQDHFRANIAIPEDELARLDGATLVPGMPIEAYLKTTDRTIMSYLTKPLTDSLRRAMRE